MTAPSKCENCTHKSEHCQDTCSEQDQPNQVIKRDGIKSVVAIMSGKGGVGKSTVTALLAATMARRGRKVGIMDSDITGPSIPRLLGLHGGQMKNGDQGLVAPRTYLGIRVMSINLFFAEEEEAVIWRGPMLNSAVKQFWEDTDWGKLDYLFVDMPPGTGDVPLTVLQTLPLDGVIIVLSPQELAVMVVKKAIRMARMMNVPILGLVENMAYLDCPHCSQKIYPFGEPQGAKVSQETGIPLLGTLPINQSITTYGDQGKIESLDTKVFEQVADELERILNKIGEQ